MASHDVMIRGEIPMERLSRLEDFRYDADSVVAAWLTICHDDQGVMLLGGQVGADLVFTCQRCLEPVVYTMTANIRLALVFSDSELDGLPAGYEPWLVSEEKLVVSEVLEEELLLSMPLVPLHDHCQAPGFQAEDTGFNTEQKINPFAVLAQLKSQDE